VLQNTSPTLPQNTAPTLPIRVVSAQKSFGTQQLWSDVHFEVGARQMIALAGPSGSGKTTLLNCLGLLERVDSGMVSYGAEDVTHAKPKLRRRLYRETVGFLFQNSGLVESWTVHANVAVALSHRRMSRKTKSQRIENALEQMGLGGRQNDRVYTLSGGEQQRVGLARLLLKEAAVVLADEPTASLDHDNSEIVIRALRNLASRGSAVVVSTHDDQLIQASDGVVQLERGSHASIQWHQSSITDPAQEYPTAVSSSRQS